MYMFTWGKLFYMDVATRGFMLHVGHRQQSSGRMYLNPQSQRRDNKDRCMYHNGSNIKQTLNIVSYPLLASAYMGIYPHTAWQYHARPKAKRGITMLSVDRFSYPRKQTKGNEFIPCSNDVYHILKRFPSFKTPAIPFILPKSSHKRSVARSYRSGKENGQRP